MSQHTTPISPREEIEGLVYFRRMCNKIRLHSAEELCPEYHPNLGGGMDLWTCQLLQVDYADVVEQAKSTENDVTVLEWCFANGYQPREEEIRWWNCFMQNCGRKGNFIDDVLALRKEEEGWADRADIATFFDFLDADEGRL